jgi:hypothetical protein
MRTGFSWARRLFLFLLVAVPLFTAVSAPADAAMACSTTVGGKTHTRHCSYVATSITYDSRKHVFIVAPDRSVWHIWQVSAGSSTYSSWTSLGGVAYEAVSLGTIGNGTGLMICVLGSDDYRWCRKYNSPAGTGTWGPWYKVV